MAEADTEVPNPLTSAGREAEGGHGDEEGTGEAGGSDETPPAPAPAPSGEEREVKRAEGEVHAQGGAQPSPAADQTAPTPPAAGAAGEREEPSSPGAAGADGGGGVAADAAPAASTGDDVDGSGGEKDGGEGGDSAGAERTEEEEASIKPGGSPPLDSAGVDAEMHSAEDGSGGGIDASRDGDGDNGNEDDIAIARTTTMSTDLLMTVPADEQLLATTRGESAGPPPIALTDAGGEHEPAAAPVPDPLAPAALSAAAARPDPLAGARTAGLVSGVWSTLWLAVLVVWRFVYDWPWMHLAMSLTSAVLAGSVSWGVLLVTAGRPLLAHPRIATPPALSAASFAASDAAEDEEAPMVRTASMPSPPPPPAAADDAATAPPNAGGEVDVRVDVGPTASDDDDDDDGTAAPAADDGVGTSRSTRLADDNGSGVGEDAASATATATAAATATGTTVQPAARTASASTSGAAPSSEYEYDATSSRGHYSRVSTPIARHLPIPPRGRAIYEAECIAVTLLVAWAAAGDVYVTSDLFGAHATWQWAVVCGCGGVGGCLLGGLAIAVASGTPGGGRRHIPGIVLLAYALAAAVMCYTLYYYREFYIEDGDLSLPDATRCGAGALSAIVVVLGSFSRAWAVGVAGVLLWLGAAGVDTYVVVTDQEEDPYNENNATTIWSTLGNETGLYKDAMYLAITDGVVLLVFIILLFAWRRAYKPIEARPSAVRRSKAPRDAPLKEQEVVAPEESSIPPTFVIEPTRDGDALASEDEDARIAVVLAAGVAAVAAVGGEDPGTSPTSACTPLASPASASSAVLSHASSSRLTPRTGGTGGSDAWAIVSTSAPSRSDYASLVASLTGRADTPLVATPIPGGSPVPSQSPATSPLPRAGDGGGTSGGLGWFIPNTEGQERCPLCMEVITGRPRHLSTCGKLPVPCPLLCGATILREETIAHATEQCPRRFEKGCPIGCGEVFDGPVAVAQHVSHCPAIPYACPLECGAYLPLSGVAQHVFDECPRRSVRCRCGELVVASEHDAHDVSCPMRMAPCPKGCGVRVPHRAMQAHISTGCREGMTCKVCGAFVPNTDVVEHLAGHAEVVSVPVPAAGEPPAASPRRGSAVADDARRGVVCPFNCGVAVILAEGESVAHALAQHFQRVCGRQRVACPQNCGWLVAAHAVDTHCATICTRRRVACTDCEEVMSWEHLGAHRHSQCAKRTLRCPNHGCRTSGLSRDAMHRHVMHSCAQRPARCRICLQLFALQDYHAHALVCCFAGEEDLSPLVDRTALRSCEFCAATGFDALVDLAAHLTVCAMRPVECPILCGEHVPVSIVGLHMAKPCVKRFTSCENGCEQGMRAADRGGHVTACTHAPTACPYVGCPLTLPACLMHTHTAVCQQRPLMCPRGCRQLLRAHQVADHLLGECPNQTTTPQVDMIECPRCFDMVPAVGMPHHMWKFCYMRHMLCPYACGESHLISQLPAHYSTCSKAPAPCPLGCGAIFGGREDVDMHVRTHGSCPKLSAPCRICGVLQGLPEIHAHEVACAMGREDLGRACPFGCGHAFDDIATAPPDVHLDACPRRYRTCGSCGDILIASLMEEHAREACRSRLVACSKCGATGIEAADLPNHVYTCRGETAVCPIGCGKMIPADDIASHIKVCRMMPTVCPNECGSYVAPLGAALAVGEAVPRRHRCSPEAVRIPCPHGCGQNVPMRGLAAHRAGQCPKLLVACKQRCGLVVPIDGYMDHSLRGCPHAPIQCDWCHEYLTVQELPTHRAEVCSRRPIPCRSGCGMVFHSDAAARAHQEDECVRRMITCPLHCDAPPFPVFQMGYHGMICNIMLSHHMAVFPDEEAKARAVPTAWCPLGCDAEITLTGWKDHTHTCPKIPVECPEGCGEWVPREKLRAHAAESCVYRKNTCMYGCGETFTQRQANAHYRDTCQLTPFLCPFPTCPETVTRRSVAEHMEGCAHRPVACPSGCGAVIPASRVDLHVEECAASPPEQNVLCKRGCGVRGCGEPRAGPFHAACPLEHVACTLPGCNATTLQRDIATHAAQHCPQRNIFCIDCGEPHAYADDRAHQATCLETFITCYQGCEARIRRSALQPHLAQFCTNRKHWCRFGCGMAVVASQVEMHEAQCDRRPVGCPHCGLVFAKGEGHEAVCPKRMVHCQHCGKQMAASELEAKHNHECQHRPVPCEYCRILLPLSEHPIHDRQCEKRTFCVDCKATVRPGALQQHLATQCPFRAVPCPLCKELVPLNAHEEHKNVCPLAKMRCDICTNMVVRRLAEQHRETCRQVTLNDQKVKGVRAFLGIDVVDYRKFGEVVACQVCTVLKQSCAERQGLKEGMVLLAMDEREVHSRNEFMGILKDRVKPFELLRLKVVPREAAASLRGRSRTGGEHRQQLLARAHTATVKIGTLPHMSFEEYYATKHGYSLLTLKRIELMFYGGGLNGGPKHVRIERISTAEAVDLFQSLGVEVQQMTLEVSDVGAVGFSLVEVLDWIRTYGYVEVVEAHIGGAPGSTPDDSTSLSGSVSDTSVGSSSAASSVPRRAPPRRPPVAGGGNNSSSRSGVSPKAPALHAAPGKAAMHRGRGGGGGGGMNTNPAGAGRLHSRSPPAARRPRR